MNFYPVLTSRILDSEVVIFNFPPYYYHRDRYHSEVFIYSAEPNGDQWKIIKEGILGPGEFRSFHHVAGNSKSIFYFMSMQNYPKTLSELPSEERFQDMEVNWRATLSLKSQYTCASYQGDYPAEMLNIRQGTLLSIAPIIQMAPGVINKIFFINLKRKPWIEEKSIYISNLETKKRIFKIMVKTNHCNEIDVSNLSLENGSYYYVHSNEIAGIPVYFTSDEQFLDMSLEHTHPPHAFLAFGSAERVQGITREMKKWWIV